MELFSLVQTNFDLKESIFVDIEGRENVVNWFATNHIGESSNYNSFGVGKV